MKFSLIEQGQTFRESESIYNKERRQIEKQTNILDKQSTDRITDRQESLPDKTTKILSFTKGEEQEKKGITFNNKIRHNV